MYWSVNDTNFSVRFAWGKPQNSISVHVKWNRRLVEFFSSGNNRAGRCHGKIFQGKPNNKCSRRKEEGGKWRKQVKADRCCQTRAVWLVEINAGPTCNLLAYFFKKINFHNTEKRGKKTNERWRTRCELMCMRETRHSHLSVKPRPLSLMVICSLALNIRRNEHRPQRWLTSMPCVVWMLWIGNPPTTEHRPVNFKQLKWDYICVLLFLKVYNKKFVFDAQ